MLLANTSDGTTRNMTYDVVIFFFESDTTMFRFQLFFPPLYIGTSPNDSSVAFDFSQISLNFHRMNLQRLGLSPSLFSDYSISFTYHIFSLLFFLSPVHCIPRIHLHPVGVCDPLTSEHYTVMILSQMK